MVGRIKKSHDRRGAIGFETPFPSSMRQNHEQRHSVVVKAENINPKIRKTEEKVVDSVVIEELSKPLTAYCRCWRSGNFPLEGCDPSWTIETTKARPNASDLDVAFRELMAVNWLINGYETLSIDRDAARAVMVLNKLGFADAMGLYKSCSYLFEHRRRSRALPFNEGSFDFVVSTEMIDDVKVPARMVLEMEGSEAGTCRRSHVTSDWQLSGDNSDEGCRAGSSVPEIFRRSG